MGEDNVYNFIPTGLTALLKWTHFLKITAYHSWICYWNYCSPLTTHTHNQKRNKLSGPDGFTGEFYEIHKNKWHKFYKCF